MYVSILCDVRERGLARCLSWRMLYVMLPRYEWCGGVCELRHTAGHVRSKHHLSKRGQREGMSYSNTYMISQHTMIMSFTYIPLTIVYHHKSFFFNDNYDT